MSDRPGRGDASLVVDIVGAVEKIQRWSGDGHAQDDLYRAGVLRELGVIGEAASHLSEAFQDAHRQIPWRQVVGLRNNLVHEDWDTAWEIVERILVDDLPVLLRTLTPLVVKVDIPDVDDLAGAVASRTSLQVLLRGQAPDGEQQRLLGADACGAWMPLARARCVLAKGHSATRHHRSK